MPSYNLRKRAAQHSPTQQKAKKKRTSQNQMEILLQQKNEAILENEVLNWELEANKQKIEELRSEVTMYKENQRKLEEDLEFLRKSLRNEKKDKLRMEKKMNKMSEKAAKELKHCLDDVNKLRLEAAHHHSNAAVRIIETDRPVRAKPECPVCFEEYVDNVDARCPKVIGCGHTLCQECASAIWEKPRLKCPICQTVTGNVETIEGLPKNYMVFSF